MLQIAKDVPQPQDELAFGLRIWKLEPARSSTKSSIAPPSRSNDTSSTTTRESPWAKTRSSSLALSSRSKPYWKPEQPPPEIAIRSISPGCPSRAASSALRAAALSVTTNCCADITAASAIGFLLQIGTQDLGIDDRKSTRMNSRH